MIRQPLRFFSATILVTVVTLLALGGYDYRTFLGAIRDTSRDLRLQELVGMIGHLDEVLTTSARMAAVTGDPAWAERYGANAPKLEAAIAEAGQLVPEASLAAAHQTAEANRRLVDMERRALAQAAAGSLADAQAILFSEEYEAQKWIYQQGMRRAVIAMRQRIAESQLTRFRQKLLSMGFIGAALLLLVIAWIAAFWTMRRWQSALVASAQDLETNADTLRSVNQSLDARVAERTGELQSRNQELNAAKERIEQQARTLQAANKKLQELAVLKDEFVAKASHELRTPLTSIKEGLSLLIDDALGPTTAEQQDFLKTMDGDVDRLTELINNMLDIAKIEAGRMRLLRSRVDLEPLLQSLIRSYQPLAGRRVLAIERNGRVPVVFADSNRLLQVLTNLLSNALKFTPDGGRIAFHLGEQDGMATVAVQDSGMGISPEDLTKLFQKFSQVGAPTADRPRGTGLGLVVCKELVELHGGRIDVSSAPGRGTTFTVRLPVYSDTFALTECFREQLDLAAAEEGRVAVLVLVDAAAWVRRGPAGAGTAEALAQLALDVRQCLHRGDAVLTMEGSRIAVLAAADKDGAGAIVRRLQEKLPDAGLLRFGTAVPPEDGTSIEVLFRQAVARANTVLQS